MLVVIGRAQARARRAAPPGPSARSSTRPCSAGADLRLMPASRSLLAERQPRARHPPRLAVARIAAREPHGHRCPTRSKRSRSPTRISPPQTVPSGPRPVAVEDRAHGAARRSRARPGTRPGARGDAARRSARRRGLMRVLRRQVVRMQVVGDHLGRRRANTRSKCSTPSVNERSVSTFSRSPM